MWSQDWTWTFIHDDVLRDCLRQTEGYQAASTTAIVDCQSVTTPGSKASKRGYDAGKKLSGRKRHVAVDSALTIRSTAASTQHREAVRPLIRALVGLCGRLQIICAHVDFQGTLVDVFKQRRRFNKLRLEIAGEINRECGGEHFEGWGSNTLLQR